MPVYEYRCDDCGPFDQLRNAADATSPLQCPACSRPARRAYTAFGARARAGALGAAGRADRGRIDRALSGEPARTGLPTGRRLPASPHSH